MIRQAACCYRGTDAQASLRQPEAFLDRWRASEPRALGAFVTEWPRSLNSLHSPTSWHRCLRPTDSLERLFRQCRQPTKLIGSLAQPVRLEPRLLGIVIPSPWRRLPIHLQPLLAPDTMIDGYLAGQLRDCVGAGLVARSPAHVTRMRVATSVLLGVWTAAVGWAAPAQTNGWTSLYNGQNLDGWVQRGGKARYRAEGPELVGSSVPNTPNSFLCTARSYTNFILEFEFKADPQLNSGVQIRSECFEQPRRVEWQGRSIAIPAGRVHGYQVEIDPDAKRARWWTGGIYDEARRGWLFPGPLGGDPDQFTSQGKEAFKPGDWNHVRVEAVGETIKTWLNGVPRAEIKDSMTPAGFIALQVHGVGKRTEPLEVRWRNLRIKELP